MKMLLGAVALSLAAAGSAHAASVTIDFGGGTQGLPYSEDSFTLSLLDSAGSVTPFEVLGSELLNSVLVVGETAEFTRVGGGLFSLSSFMFRSIAQGSWSDAFKLLGFRDGNQVADFGGFETVAGSFINIANSNDERIDALRIVGVGTNQAAPLWDNFVFTTYETSVIPLPASLPLLGAGLVGMALVGRRKRR